MLTARQVATKIKNHLLLSPVFEYWVEEEGIHERIAPETFPAMFIESFGETQFDELITAIFKNPDERLCAKTHFKPD